MLSSTNLTTNQNYVYQSIVENEPFPFFLKNAIAKCSEDLKKTEAVLFEYYYKSLMGPKTEPMDKIDHWIYEIVKLAGGINASDLKRAGKFIEKLTEKIGVSNAYLVLYRCKQLAYGIKMANKNFKDFERNNEISNALSFFGEQIEELTKNLNLNFQENLLVPKDNEKFDKADVNRDFIKSFENEILPDNSLNEVQTSINATEVTSDKKLKETITSIDKQNTKVALSFLPQKKVIAPKQSLKVLFITGAIAAAIFGAVIGFKTYFYPILDPLSEKTFSHLSHAVLWQDLETKKMKCLNALEIFKTAKNSNEIYGTCNFNNDRSPYAQCLIPQISPPLALGIFSNDYVKRKMHDLRKIIVPMQFVEAGYEVKLRQSKNPQEICTILQEVEQEFGRPIDHLLLSMHGNPTDSDWEKGDLNTATQFPENCFKSLHSQASISLLSCSAGSLSPQYNLAQHIAEVTQRKVFAPRADVSSSEFHVIKERNSSLAIRFISKRWIAETFSETIPFGVDFTRIFYPKNRKKN